MTIRLRCLPLRSMLIISTLILMTAGLRAQGIFLSHGQSGFGLSSSYVGNDKSYGIALATGYSFGGLLDVGFAASRLAVAKKVGVSDVNAVLLQPSITLHAKEGAPLSVALQAAYGHEMYSTAALDLALIPLKKDFFIGTALFYATLLSNSRFELLPVVSVTYTTANANISDGYRDRLLTAETNPFEIGVAANLVFHPSFASSFNIGPGVVIDQNNTSLQVGVGVVWGTAQ